LAAVGSLGLGVLAAFFVVELAVERFPAGLVIVFFLALSAETDRLRPVRLRFPPISARFFNLIEIPDQIGRVSVRGLELDGFQGEEVFDSVGTELAAVAGLLSSAEGGEGIESGTVDLHLAGVELTGNPAGPVRVG